MQTDDELVQLACAGDKSAFGELMMRYHTLAVHIAHGIIAQEEIVNELLQEAFLSAYLSLHQLRETDRFKQWLTRIVLNTCYTYLRNQHSPTFSLEAFLGGLPEESLAHVPQFSGEPDPQHIVEEREQQQELQKAMHVLTANERAVTHLFYEEQMSVQEIAKHLHISHSAVKSRLFQARKRLRSVLSSPYMS